MPNPIKPRRSWTANAVPQASDFLSTNELLINWADGIVYGKNPTTNAVVSYTLGGSGGGGAAEDPRWAYLLPSAPTGVTASPGNAQATVTWTAPASVAPITDYYVQYSSNSGSTWTTFSETTVSITAQPTNQTAASGSATFSVAASVTPSGTATYQWQRSTDSGSTWSDVAGATSESLSLTGLSSSANGHMYRVTVSSVGASAVTSNAATLTVGAAPLTLAGTRPTTLASGNTTTGYTLSGAGTAGSPVDLKLGIDNNSDARVWLIVNQTGTLNWTVTASSEEGYDGGRLYSHAGPPANHTAQGYNQAPQAGYTAISNWFSGTQTQSGTTAVTAGQHIVLQMTKDSEETVGNDRVELLAYIN